MCCGWGGGGVEWWLEGWRSGVVLWLWCLFVGEWDWADRDMLVVFDIRMMAAREVVDGRWEEMDLVGSMVAETAVGFAGRCILVAGTAVGCSGWNTVFGSGVVIVQRTEDVGELNGKILRARKTKAVI